MLSRVLLPWNAAALPEIMAGALQESKLDVPVPFLEGRAAGQQPALSARTEPRWASSRAASPECEGVVRGSKTEA